MSQKLYRVGFRYKHLDYLVVSDEHFPSWERADAVRKKLIACVRWQDDPETQRMSVVVLPNKKYEALRKDEKACCMSRIKANEEFSPRIADLCNTKGDLLKMRRMYADFRKG